MLVMLLFYCLYLLIPHTGKYVIVNRLPLSALKQTNKKKKRTLIQPQTVRRLPWWCHSRCHCLCERDYLRSVTLVTLRRATVGGSPREDVGECVQESHWRCLLIFCCCYFFRSHLQYVEQIFFFFFFNNRLPNLEWGALWGGRWMSRIVWSRLSSNWSD